MLPKNLPSYLFRIKLLQLMLIASVITTSCDDPSEVQKAGVNLVPQDIIQKLNDAGFDTSEGLIKFKDGYIVEYDIYMTNKMISELEQTGEEPSNGRTQHYRRLTVVNGVRTLLVFMDPTFNNEMQNAFDIALQRYNALDLRLTFRRTANSNEANIRILAESIPTQPGGGEILGFSQFPSGGNPGSPIVLNTRFYNLIPRRADAITTLAHEIGHAIGFRHTDYMNRRFSCGPDEPNPNEGGIVLHIPGTPTDPVENSWMLSCSNNTDRPFTVEDVTALRTLYRSDLRIYDLSVTNDLIVSLDYDGDNDDDLICYRPGNRIAYLFEFRNGAYVARFGGEENGFVTYDLSSLADRIVTFDYNGDGFDDVLLYRPGNRAVHIMRSEGNGTFTNVYFSNNGFFGYDLSSTNDKIIGTDYNNDGSDDIVCYRPGNRIFKLYRSDGNGNFTMVVNSSSGLNGYDLSAPHDLIISLDYDGDGMDDLGFYRPGNRVFYLLRSNGNGSYTTAIASHSGLATYDLNSYADRLIRLNINGDAFDDIAAYRPGKGSFHVMRSDGNGFTSIIASNGGIMAYNFDSTADKAIAPDYNADGMSDLLCYRPGKGTIFYGRSTGTNFVREY